MTQIAAPFPLFGEGRRSNGGESLYFCKNTTSKNLTAASAAIRAK